MLEPRRSDRSLRTLVKTRDLITLRRRQNPESGQATTEFALILFPLLVLVGGIIYFGIGLNYWLDMQRIANQGARWAAVNNWPPDCPVGTADPPRVPVAQHASGIAQADGDRRWPGGLNGHAHRLLPDGQHGRG